MLVPVIKMAIARGHDVSVLGLTTARAVLEKAGVSCIGFSELWHHAAPSARIYGEALAADLGSGGVVSHEESVAYLGISFADLVAEHGEAEARGMYAREGRHAFLPVAFFTRVLDALRPDVVVATNSPRAERAALLASGILGIRAVCAVDLFALQEVRWIGQPGYADRICVLNEAVRGMFLAHGRSPDEVVVTGNPAFDMLNAPETVTAGRALRAERGWDDSRITVLWASQIEPAHHPFNGAPGDPSLPRQVERMLRGMVAGDDTWRLVVRYHPSEREAFVPAPHVCFSPTSEPLAVLLHAVDVAVVTASTVGLEAWIAGRPVVTVDCSVFTEDAPYSRMGVSTGVADPAELPLALKRVLATVRNQAGVGVTVPDKTTTNAATAVLGVIETLLFDGV